MTSPKYTLSKLLALILSLAFSAACAPSPTSATPLPDKLAPSSATTAPAPSTPIPTPVSTTARNTDLTYELLSGTWQKVGSADTITFDPAAFIATDGDFDRVKADTGNNIYYQIDGNDVSLFESGGAHINPIAYSYDPATELLTFVDWRDKSRSEPITDEKYVKKN